MVDIWHMEVLQICPEPTSSRYIIDVYKRQVFYEYTNDHGGSYINTFTNGYHVYYFPG